jgi:[ribosomal protein S5]-alanine N-acetyltransferase
MLAPDSYFLKSARLGFRCWTNDDLALASALWGDPDVTRLLGGPFSENDVQRKLDAEIARQAEFHVQYWPVFLLSSNEHAGCAGLRPYRPEEKILELGFHLKPAYWGQGLAEEAGRAVAGFAFNELGVKGLFAGHHPENAASSRVLNKLGFLCTREEFYAPTGLMHPSYLLMRK